MSYSRFAALLDGSVKSTKRGTFRLVQSVEATDDRTVIFKLKEPFAPFLWNLTRGGIGIVPEGSAPNVALNPIGSGAFKFVRYIPDGEVVLERNDSYYGEKPRISTVVFKIVPEAVVRALELRKGSVDIALNVLPPDTVSVLKDNDELEVMEAPGTNYQYIAFNLKDPVFSDLRVRKAIAHAIDREKIIKYLWKRSGETRDGRYSQRQLVLCGGRCNLSLRPGARPRALARDRPVRSVIHFPNINRRNNAVAGHRVSAAVEGGRHRDEYSSQ